MTEKFPTKEIWTPLKIIQWAIPFLTKKGIANPRFEAECLVAHAMNLDRLKVYLQFDRPLDVGELKIIRDYLSRRALHEPVSYIIGNKEFYGHSFKVTREVLIPRPETEHLVENALSFLKMIPSKKKTVLDLGTGSGCIAISLALNGENNIWAVDISESALNVAQKNAELAGLNSSICWRLGDWFSALKEDDPGQFNVIVSNPPYIPEKEKEEMTSDVLEFEPNLALFPGKTGLEAYETIAKSLWERLLPGGTALFELHATQSEAIQEVFAGEDWGKEVLYDLQNLPRVLVLKKSSIS
jgi:release factor glutamine methyltransferase